MKNSKWIWILSAVLFAGMVSAVGCKKGDTGPAGPAGPDSVFSSAWIALNPTFDTGDSLFEQVLTAPSITQGILDSGIILSYVNFGGAGSDDIVSVPSLGSFFLEDFSVGSISISIVPVFDPSQLPYRYVTIPGSKIIGNKTTGSVNGYTIQELKKLPYSQVQEIVGN